MHVTYEGDINHPASMAVEQKVANGEFKPLSITVSSAGFLVFVYSIFTCQHLYMYTNAAERGLVLQSAVGTFDLAATDDWMLSEIHVDFEVKLRSGNPTPDDVDYIQGRMNQCPVSRNLHPSKAHDTKLRFI